MNQTHENQPLKPLIPLVYMDDMNKDILTTIKDLGKDHIITETVVPRMAAAADCSKN